MVSKYGFIITRHVNSEITNKYWNHAIRCIRRFYPYRKIIIIDDNSNQLFVKPEYDYKNIMVIKSEYPGRGELLPYYYFYKNKFFENAVILHDSVFFHKRINFEKFVLQGTNVIPLWHFDYQEDKGHTLRIITHLKNYDKIIEKINEDQVQLFSFRSSSIWHGCFGVQSYINHEFLSLIQNKYKLFNLLNVITTRKNRCCLERIMGAIFYTEYPNLYKCPSILGNIWKYSKWGYSFQEYIQNYKKHKNPLIKVWSGR